MQKYVLSFVFSGNLDSVLLVRKQRPAWQRGLLNGVGGHVEVGESFREAAARELREETGLGPEHVCLERLAFLQEKDARVWVYCGRLLNTNNILLLPSAPDTGEEIVLFPLYDITVPRVGYVHDLLYLVYMASAKLRGLVPHRQFVMTDQYPVDMVDDGFKVES